MGYTDPTPALHAYMATYTGRYVNLLAPHPDDIDEIDLAHHLATTNRWCGAALRPISVAEHCLLVVEILEHELKVGDPAVQLVGQLHDAHEAYLQDDTTPKRQAAASMSAQADAAHRELRGRWDAAIWKKFGITTAALNARTIVKLADRIALATERRDLMTEHATPWPALEGVHAVEWVDLRQRDAMTWQDWRHVYVDKLHELQFAMRLRADELSRGQLGCEGSAL